MANSATAPACAARALIEELTKIVGAQHVLTDEADYGPRLIDNRSRLHGRVDCAVRPANTSQTAAVMRAAKALGALVFTQGGNTSNVGGATPVSSNAEAPRLLLLTDRMRAVEVIDTINDTVLVQAGCPLSELREAAALKGRLFPVSLAAEGTCTVGGILATNAGGVHVLSYGNTREQCLGLEVVLEDGRILDMLRGLRKDNTGYDLKDLFIGSEGTLGIITRAVMKLRPAPTDTLVCLMMLPASSALSPSFSALSSAFAESLTAFEVMHRDTVVHVSRVWPEVTQSIDLSHPWYALAEISIADAKSVVAGQALLEETLAELFERNQIADAILAQSERQKSELWRVRESIPEAHKKTGGNVKHDISVPRSSLVAFVEETNALLKALFPWIQPSVFGHFGDGNLHYNMGVCEGSDPRLCFLNEERIHEVVYEQIARFRGSVAAEHGVGRFKHDLLACVKTPAEYALLRAVKTAFDPQGRLNPGAVVDALPAS